MPMERSKLPHIFYRLIAEPPLWCEFPSTAYHVRVIPCLAAGRYELTAYDHTRAVEMSLASCHSPEMLRVAIFTDGFLVRTDTLAGTIMRRLVRDGVAVIVHTP